MQGLRYMIQGVGCRVKSNRFREWGAGLRVIDSGGGVQG